MKFRVLTSNHNEGGKTYRKGDIVESDKELDKLFVLKFARVDEGESTPSNPASGGSATDLGEDITDEFTVANEVGLKVYIKGGWCKVVDPVNDEVLNASGIRRDAVEGFINDLD